MGRVKNHILKRSAALAVLFSITATGNAPAAPSEPEDGWYGEKYHSYTDYSEMEYEGFDRAEIDGLINELEKLCGLGDGNHEAAVINIYGRILSQVDWLMTQQQLNSLIYYKDATNEEAQEREQELSKTATEIQDRLFVVLKDALESPYGDMLREEIGESGLEQLENYQKMTDREFELEEKDTALIQEYNEALLANYTATVNGEEWTTERYEAEPPEDADEEYQVYKALAIEKNKAAGEIYREMVQVRNEIARESGYNNYAEYAYEQIYQRDFSTEDIKSVYKEVKDHIVPLYEDMLMAQAMTDIVSLVEATQDKTGEDILDEVEPYIGQVHPDLTEAYSYMRDYHLYDIEADDKKLNVGFTTDLPSYGVPFIFNNPYGYYQDYKTVIHEFGHYNEMFHWPEPALWQTSRMDVYEIHSQGLEVLFYPYAGDLFGEGGEAFQYETIATMLYSIREGCLYDEFQNVVYNNPDMTLEELNQTFFCISQEYGYHYEEGAQQAYSWVEVPHTFESPMYYIGYATSALAALDIWMESLDNRDEAVNKYMYLTTLGGSEPFRKVMEDAGFDDIFQEGVIKKMTDSIRGIMDVNGKVAEYGLQHEKEIDTSAELGVIISVGVAAILIIGVVVVQTKKRKKREAEERVNDGQ